jgi:hypothetical protein
MIPSLDLVRRVTETAAAYTVARMHVLERIPAIRSASPIAR